MRKIVIGLLLAASVAGCTTTGGFVPPTVQDVQAATVSACAFLPTATTVAAIVASLSGRDSANVGVQTASAVAAAICTALQNAPASESGGIAPVRVNGVVVKGVYTR